MIGEAYCVLSCTHQGGGHLRTIFKSLGGGHLGQRECRTFITAARRRLVPAEEEGTVDHLRVYARLVRGHDVRPRRIQLRDLLIHGQGMLEHAIDEGGGELRGRRLDLP